MSNPLLTDRTTTETDWKCGMARWWYKEEQGTGIVPVVEAKYFEEGRDIHADFQFLAQAPDPVIAAMEIVEGVESRMSEANGDQILLEPLARRAGWVAAQAIYVEPETRRTHENVGLEHELVLERDPLWFVVTPDRILRQRERPQRMVYRDYKGVGGWGATNAWVAHWDYAIQQHTVLKAIEEEFGEAPIYAQIMGLWKGQEKDGRLYHPYVWAFYDEVNDEWFPLGSGKRGLTYRPVWEYPEGIMKWVEKCGKEIAEQMFPFSRPIFLNERLLDELIVSRTRRETEVMLFREKAQVDRDIRAQHFESRYSECRPVIGAPCPYIAACHNASINEDPLKSGLFVRRTPHHELEVISK